jgi:2-haloacid dehalogenase
VKIKNYIFDFGGVLVDWNPFYLYRHYFLNDSEIQSFLDRSQFMKINKLADDGEKFSDLCNKFHLSKQDADLILIFRDQFLKSLGGVIQKNVDKLYELKSEGYKLYGLTNWSAETFPKAFEEYGFFKLFDGIVVSGVEKVSKPNLQIYQILLQRYSLKASECFFLDDRKENVEAAKQLGIDGDVV